MENAIKIFENEEFGNIRVAMSENNEPLFCLADICRVLSLQVTPTKNRLKQDGVSLIKGVSKTTNQYGVTTEQEVMLTFINEQNLYKVIMRSDKPQAEPFQDWVCGEVLPSIRKTGGYMMAKEEDSPETIMARAFIIAKETIARQQSMIEDQHERLDAQAKELKEAAPKVQYYDAAMASMGTYSATAIAKDLGMSAKELNKRLYAIGVQFKNGETWYPYAKYQDKGYTRIVPKYITTKEGEEINKPSMRWTEKGRKFILQLRSEGRI